VLERNIEVTIGRVGSVQLWTGRVNLTKKLSGTGRVRINPGRVGFWVEHYRIFLSFGFLVAHVISDFGSGSFLLCFILGRVGLDFGSSDFNFFFQKFIQY
jgi:hypothetical protein